MWASLVMDVGDMEDGSVRRHPRDVTDHLDLNEVSTVSFDEFRENPLRTWLDEMTNCK